MAEDHQRKKPSPALNTEAPSSFDLSQGDNPLRSEDDPFAVDSWSSPRKKGELPPLPRYNERSPESSMEFDGPMRSAYMSMPDLALHHQHSKDAAAAAAAESPVESKTTTHHENDDSPQVSPDVVRAAMGSMAEIKAQGSLWDLRVPQDANGAKQHRKGSGFLASLFSSKKEKGMTHRRSRSAADGTPGKDDDEKPTDNVDHTPAKSPDNRSTVADPKAKGKSIPLAFKVGVEHAPKVVPSKTQDSNRPRPKLSENTSRTGVSTSTIDIDDYNSSSSALEEKSTTSSNSHSKKKKSSSFLRRESSDSTPSISKSKATHQEIEVEHREYEVTYDMMLGIRTMIGATYGHQARDLVPDDFEFVDKRSFPASGTNKTPGHKMRDFKFKDYHPEVFRRIRERFGIDAAEYTMTVTNNPYLEFISNSKSGQFFFFTHNKQFMIKTMSKEECKFLRKILPDYYRYVMENPNTLLTRYYGIHRVEPAGSRKIRFLIMGSVFFTDKFIHEVYDLKGSTYGRQASAKEKQQAVPVLKDLDFLEQKAKIHIEPKKAAELVSQIEKDAQFLQHLNIMDYSLLLGMHYTDRIMPTETLDVKEDDFNLRRFSTPERRQSHYGLKNQQVVLSATTEFSSPDLPVVEEVADLDIGSDAPSPKASPKSLPEIDEVFEKKTSNPHKNVSIFCSDSGGVRGVKEDNSPSNVIYFMGIIDILQQYNAKKKFETTYKSISVDLNQISSVKPPLYATRFSHFLSEAIILPKSPSS